jgi:hypothetical protein
MESDYVILAELDKELAYACWDKDQLISTPVSHFICTRILEAVAAPWTIRISQVYALAQQQIELCFLSLLLCLGIWNTLQL